MLLAKMNAREGRVEELAAFTVRIDKKTSFVLSNCLSDAKGETATTATLTEHTAQKNDWKVVEDMYVDG